MEKETRKNRLTAKLRTAQELPVFSDAQVQTINSRYVDSLDETLAVLDETNRTAVGKTRAFAVNEDEK